MTAHRIFELRTYHTTPGNLEPLSNRFREHTLALFEKHNIEVVGFWAAHDEDDPSTGRLIYICAFESRDAAGASWKAFITDPEWERVRNETEQHGPLSTSIDSVFMEATAYSAIQ